MLKFTRPLIRYGLVLLLAGAASLQAQDLKPVQLPSPRTTGGMPLMEALANRKTTREFSDRAISPQVLSNLLWAAWGINRPDGRRTAPSAVNWQPVDVYVALKEGFFRYDAKGNTLEPVLSEDIRALTGSQDFVGTAPLNLVYVAETLRIPRDIPFEQKVTIASTDVGFIAQNVYLFCASEGLGCVVRGRVDKEALAKKAGLSETQRVLLAHTVGYPKE